MLNSTGTRGGGSQIFLPRRTVLKKGKPQFSAPAGYMDLWRMSRFNVGFSDVYRFAASAVFTLLIWTRKTLKIEYGWPVVTWPSDDLPISNGIERPRSGRNWKIVGRANMQILPPILICKSLSSDELRSRLYGFMAYVKIPRWLCRRIQICR